MNVMRDGRVPADVPREVPRSELGIKWRLEDVVHRSYRDPQPVPAQDVAVQLHASARDGREPAADVLGTLELVQRREREVLV
jgi:hypothetical protein